MKVDGKPYRTIWLNDDGISVGVIDQTLLPHRFKIEEWRRVEDVAGRIRKMVVGGAPLIGASAGYGVALATLRDPSNKAFQRAYELLFASRPTAVNLRWALDRIRQARPVARDNGNANGSGQYESPFMLRQTLTENSRAGM